MEKPERNENGACDRRPAGDDVASRFVCVFLCIPLFDCKMRTLIVLRPLLGKHCFCKMICHKGVWVPLTPPFLRRRFVVNIPLANPLLKSVSCVPPPLGGVLGKTLDEFWRGILGGVRDYLGEIWGGF